MNTLFVPKVCREWTNIHGKTVPATFSGEMIIRLPSADERYEIFGINQVSVDEVEKVSHQSAHMRTMAEIVRRSYDHIVKIDLTKLSDKTKVITVEDLKYDPDCFQIMVEIAEKMLNGFALGKNS